MDMSMFNKGIMEAPDQTSPQDGPRYPDGQYSLAVVTHDDKFKGEVQPNGLFPTMGLWVTFKICDGPYKGKDYKCYFGVKNDGSPESAKYGKMALKQLYKAINFIPTQFEGVYGKRFLATFKSKKNDDASEYPWSTNIVKYEATAAPQGQAFNNHQQQGAQNVQNHQQYQQTPQQQAQPDPIPQAGQTLQQLQEAERLAQAQGGAPQPMGADAFTSQVPPINNGQSVPLNNPAYTDPAAVTPLSAEEAQAIAHQEIDEIPF